MDTRPFEIIAFLCIVLLCWRVYIAIRLDRMRTGGKVFFTKFLFGIYALEALLPILRNGDNKEERQLIKTANRLVILFYVLAVGFFIAVKYTV